MHINWIGPVFGSTGYARHNREMIHALQDLGVEIHVTPCDSTQDHIPEYIEKALNTPRKEDGITIHLSPSPALWGDDGYNILLTTIESMPAHPGLIRRASMFPEVWTVSKYNHSAIAPYLPGATIKKIIQEGYNPKVFYRETPKKFETFTFIYLGDWSFRKGCHELVQAFCEEFQRGEAQLYMITKLHQVKNDPKSQKTILKEAKEYATRNGYRLHDVYFFHIDYPDETLRYFYTQAHCFIMPTKGEAWGLPIMEAMACGLPVIVPDIGGQREFTSEKTGWLTTGYYDRLDKYLNITIDFYQGQFFYFPNIHSVKKAMREAYTHPEQCDLIGYRNSRYVFEKFTWDKAAQKAYNRLQEIENKGYANLRNGRRL